MLIFEPDLKKRMSNVPGIQGSSISSSAKAVDHVRQAAQNTAPSIVRFEPIAFRLCVLNVNKNEAGTYFKLTH